MQWIWQCWLINPTSALRVCHSLFSSTCGWKNVMWHMLVLAWQLICSETTKTFLLIVKKNILVFLIGLKDKTILQEIDLLSCQPMSWWKEQEGNDVLERLFASEAVEIKNWKNWFWNSVLKLLQWMCDRFHRWLKRHPKMIKISLKIGLGWLSLIQCSKLFIRESEQSRNEHNHPNLRNLSHHSQFSK